MSREQNKYGSVTVLSRGIQGMAIDGVYILLFYVFLFQPRNVVIGERYLEIRDKSLKRVIDDRIFTRILPVMIVSSQTW